jgi:tight adherence protein B
MLAFNLIMVFILTFLYIYILSLILFARPKTISRLEKYLNPDKNNENKVNIKARVRLQPRKILSIIGDRISNITLMQGYIKKKQKELTRGGIPLKGEEFLAVQTLMLILTAFVSFNISDIVFISFIAGFFGWLLPGFILKIRKGKRYKLFNEQLGDAIVLISNSLKAGHSFLQAVDSVSKEMPSPISKEFDKVLKEMRLGVSTEKALENLLDRVESDDLELMVTAVIIQRQIGGNLSEILDNLSDTIRERVRLKGEIRTLTAQGRLSGIVISLLPIVISVILFLISPDYLMELFNNPIGALIISIAVINQLIGIFMISRIVKIEV